MSMRGKDILGRIWNGRSDATDDETSNGEREPSAVQEAPSQAPERATRDDAAPRPRAGTPVPELAAEAVAVVEAAVASPAAVWEDDDDEEDADLDLDAWWGDGEGTGDGAAGDGASTSEPWWDTDGASETPDEDDADADDWWVVDDDDAVNRASQEMPGPSPVEEEATVQEEAPEPVQDESPEQVADEAPEPVQEEAPEPVQEEAPEPVQDEAPEQVQDEAPEQVQEEAPEPVQDEAPEPVQEEAPEPVQGEAPEPVQEEAPDPVQEDPRIPVEPPRQAASAPEAAPADARPEPAEPPANAVTTDEEDASSRFDIFSLEAISAQVQVDFHEDGVEDDVVSDRAEDDVVSDQAEDDQFAGAEQGRSPEPAAPSAVGDDFGEAASEPAADVVAVPDEDADETLPPPVDVAAETAAEAPAGEALPAEREEAAAPEQEMPEPALQEPASSSVSLAMGDRVVARLLDKGMVTPEQVDIAVRDRESGKHKATLWRVLTQQVDVDREQIYREAALTYAFKEREVRPEDIDLDFVLQVADAFPEEKRNRLLELHVMPVGYDFEPQTQALRIVFITHDPSLGAVREALQDLKLERYEVQYAPEATVTALLAKAFPRKNEYLERMSDDPLAFDLGTSYEEDEDLLDEEALEAEINRSSLINLFEAALVEAVRIGASDIHIFPNAKRHIEIHMRVDGQLKQWHVEERVAPESLLAVIKDNSTNVDRFERDMAQDGFIQRRVDDALIRYRVSVLPIATSVHDIHAESIVIRVLDDRKVITDLGQLGLLKGAVEKFDQAIRQPHGMVILTGPTGSGKSTTLVAALHQVVSPTVNVLTVEDPVEYIIPGVRQIKLNHKLGLEQALRAILRHDPDVVMVGEMRDRQTAELAIKLANTGHLTFSTLHTNDAPSAISRLYKMGVEPFLIAYAINLVVAQRLIRRLCPTCKAVDDDPDPVLLERLGFTDQDQAATTFYRPVMGTDCPTCRGVGYKGRRAISEALYFSRAVRHLIVAADRMIDEQTIREQATKDGMLTLEDSAREVVKMGDTSIDEMLRVVHVQD